MPTRFCGGTHMSGAAATATRRFRTTPPSAAVEQHCGCPLRHHRRGGGAATGDSVTDESGTVCGRPGNRAGDDTWSTLSAAYSRYRRRGPEQRCPDAVCRDRRSRRIKSPARPGHRRRRAHNRGRLTSPPVGGGNSQQRHWRLRHGGRRQRQHGGPCRRRQPEATVGRPSAGATSNTRQRPPRHRRRGVRQHRPAATTPPSPGGRQHRRRRASASPPATGPQANRPGVLRVGALHRRRLHRGNNQPVHGARSTAAAMFYTNTGVIPPPAWRLTLAAASGPASRPQREGQLHAGGRPGRAGPPGGRAHHHLELQGPGRLHPPHGAHGPGLLRRLRPGRERHVHQHRGRRRRGPGRHPGAVPALAGAGRPHRGAGGRRTPLCNSAWTIWRRGCRRSKRAPARAPPSRRLVLRPARRLARSSAVGWRWCWSAWCWCARLAGGRR